MKSRIKLLLGVVFAVIAVLAASQPANPKLPGMQEPCYTESEVELLMRANHWKREQARDVLDLACEYSKKPDQ